jgi:hypothetical protein
VHRILRTLLAFVFLAAAAFAADFAETKKNADAGDAEAQYNLGLMYAKGGGVPKDFTEAVKWHRKAADQGHADAQKSLGNMYYKGEGVPKDGVEASKWSRKAAVNKDAARQRAARQKAAREQATSQRPTRGEAATSQRATRGEAATSQRATRGEAATSQRATRGEAATSQRATKTYANGTGVRKDDAEAAKRVRLAANQRPAKASTDIKKDEEDDGEDEEDDGEDEEDDGEDEEDDGEDEEDDGGMDFFLKAQMKFAQALLPATRIAEMNDEIKVMRSKTDPKEAVILTKKYIAENQAAAEIFIKKGDALNAEARSLISEGKDEAAKGVAKWALISVAAFFINKDKDLDKNTKAAIGMIIVEEAISDLSDLDEMLSTLEKINSIGSSKEQNIDSKLEISK